MTSAVGLLTLVAVPYLFALLVRTVVELRGGAAAEAIGAGDGGGGR